MPVRSDLMSEMCDDCPIGLVQQRSSNVAEHLSDGERDFLLFVADADTEGIQTLLKSKEIDTNCCDYRGQRALEIAVSHGDIDFITFLLKHIRPSTLHYYCALLQAVIQEDADILELLLDRAESNHELQSQLWNLMKGGPECPPEVSATDLTPTMAAAISGNVEVTRILLERGYCIEKPHSPKCQCQDSCSLRATSGETLTESMNRMNTYRALASPTYLILTAEDPILAAFQLSRDMEKLSHELPENQKEYKELGTKCRTFAANMLDQCRNTEEVQTVLVQKKGCERSSSHQFSRLHLALEFQQKEFVTHASCQQVLRSMWVGTLGPWYSWPFRWRAFHVVKHALLTPIISLAFIFLPRSQVISPLRVPLNRFIYFATSYLVFLCLLMITLLNDRRYDIHSPVTWTEIAVGCFVLGHSWDIFTNLMSLGITNYFRSWWMVFDLVLFSLLLLTEIMWFSVYVLNIFHPTVTNSSRDCWEWYHPILLGEGIYAAASIMAFSRLMLWFQVNSRLGPLGTSVKDMVVDVVQFFMLFFIIMLAFATGINSIYKNYKTDSTIIPEITTTEEQPEEFLTLKSTFKTLFWAIFGMGEADYAQIVVVSRNESAAKEHLFTESVGYILWGFYHMVTVVVLLNMLIAMMTESYQKVQTNSDMEWKFACSTLWLTVLDNHSVVPPPFNLIPSMHKVTLLCQWLVANLTGSSDNTSGKLSCSSKRCLHWSTEIDVEVNKLNEEKYEKLMVQLIRRYLHCSETQTLLRRTFHSDLKEERVPVPTIKRRSRYTRKKRPRPISSTGTQTNFIN